MKAILKTLIFLLTVLILSQCRKEDPVVNIPDDNFLNALIELGVDTDGDGQISPEEAEVITYLNVSGTFDEPGDIENMKGVEAFINLDTLNCNNNQLTSLDVSNNTFLTKLYCSKNQLTNLDVSNNTFLKDLYCSRNQLTSLDVTNNNALYWFDCGFNQLTSLDLSNNTALKYLLVHSNQLTILDLLNNTDLGTLVCEKNQLTSLDISNNSELYYIHCSSNLFTSIDISNNTSLLGINLDNMPTLFKVCVWEIPFPPKEVTYITTFGSPNVYFTTDCN